jgi:hypothetical protein
MGLLATRSLKISDGFSISNLSSGVWRLSYDYEDGLAWRAERVDNTYYSMQELYIVYNSSLSGWGKYGLARRANLLISSSYR